MDQCVVDLLWACSFSASTPETLCGASRRRSLIRRERGPGANPATNAGARSRRLDLKVARELGHRDTEMVERIYGHVDTRESSFPRRSYVAFELVDYQGEAFAARLDTLEACSRERNRPSPNLAKRVPAETELAVLWIAGEAPHLGPRKAAKALHDAGHEVSPSGVRWIWRRYDLHREERRREAVRNGTLRRVIEKVAKLRMDSGKD